MRSPHLLERGPLQVELSTLLHEAAEARGRLVFVGGEAGVGKSSLVRRFLDMMGDRVRVLVGACDPLTTPRPLGPLLDMRRGFGRRYAELLAGTPARERVFEGFLAELDRGEVPAVVVFEDVHWGDEATLDLLRFVGRRLEGVRALLLATWRDDEVNDRHPLRIVLGDLAGSPAVHRLTVEPLSPAAVRTLATGASVDPRRLHELTRGNPFFVTEVIAAGGSRLPATVRDAVLARAARLPAGAREVLDAAAVLGLRFDPRLVGQLVSGGESSLDGCIAGGMLQADGDRISFRHELAREAILDALPPHRRAGLHRAALSALVADPKLASDVGQLAHHAEQAGDTEAVLEYAPAAARRAASLSAHREAAEQYARALRFAAGAPSTVRAELLERFALEAGISDDHEAAVRATEELLAICRESGDRRREAWCLNFAVGCLTYLGRNAEAEAASRQAIEILEGLPPTRELGEAYAGQAGLRMLNRDNAEAIDWARRALAVAERADDVETQILAYNRLGSATMMMGSDGGETFLERSRELASRAGSHSGVALAYGNLGSGAGELYRFPLAERTLAEGIAYASRYELDANRLYMQAWYAAVLLQLGRWSDAAAAAEEVLARPHLSAISRITALTTLGRLKARRGEGDAAALLDEALALAAPTATLQRLAPVRAARAELAWLSGDHQRVMDEAHAALDLALDHRHPWLGGELLSWLARAGAQVEPPAWLARPFALQIDGSWKKAAAAWRRLHCPYEAACALAETGDPSALRRALVELRGLGARPATAATLHELRALGVRDIPRGPRAATRRNPANLTPRQLEVARLLADGLSNAEIARRLFISPKTADHHVSAVLAKLEVSTRTEAARKIVELGIAKDGEVGSPR